MYLELQKRLGGRLRGLIEEKYGLRLETIPLEIPPDLNFGELATPIAFELARKLRKAPRIIAQEIVAALGPLRGFSSFEVAGSGYINARIDRAAASRVIAAAETGPAATSGVHSLVEHTSINPNKAAHIGHLRNAILGDTFVRLLRAAGQQVDVQNYIDNTGVQVADVVVGFLHVDPKSKSEIQKRGAIKAVKRLISNSNLRNNPRFDFYCWDLYTKVSKEYQEVDGLPMSQGAVFKMLRQDYLHEIEDGNNDIAAVAECISTAVLKRHLATMSRLNIEYDFLPRESEILRLNFWALAFEQMKRTGVLRFETKGKNAGCWVMTRPGSRVAEGEPDEDAKVIVRSKRTVIGDKITYDPDSSGTVTYVGKDIAYHLWKFGLLGKDFDYRLFHTYPKGDGHPKHECWISAEHGEDPHPHFGGAQAIYNVIDSRQSDPQANVIQALRGMGYTEQADRYTHFGYEMVALTPRCAIELGYEVSPEDQARPYIEVSGRKGFGVKADDLIDKLIAATRAEVDARQTGRDEAERQLIAGQIAIGALRYFMLKFTRNSVIAFDFKDALSFEGETGPYIQYAVVRARNIFRKCGTSPQAVLAEFAGIDPAAYLACESAQEIWALWLRAARRTLVLEQSIAASEPAYLAKHAFQLAQEFNNFYHRHHILTEEDPARKTFLLATTAVVLRELIEALSLLGIESPEAM